MKFVLIFIFTACSFSFSLSQYNSPESVTYDTVSSRYFISNTSSSKIVQRDRNGVVTDFVTVGGSIHGVTVHANRVYVCNGTRVRGYDLTSGIEVMNVLISGSAFLNDLAADANGILYISDFNSKRIYKLNTNTQEYWIYVASTTNTPNGVYVDAQRNRLLLCCWGSNAPVRAVNFSDSTISTLITTPYSNCDGISLDRNNNVYISTWGIQSVVKYDINFTAPAVVIASGLSNPADIYVNRKTDTLAIPNAGNSTVVFSLLNVTSSVKIDEGKIPGSFTLQQNYPNPFNPVTNLEFGISDLGFVSLKVYDLLGKEVAVLVNEKLSPGRYKTEFNANNFPSGVYFYKIETISQSGAGSFIQTKSMILLK